MDERHFDLLHKHHPMTMNYSDTQTQILLNRSIFPKAHGKFWQICPETTFEQSMEWFVKFMAGTHKVHRNIEGSDLSSSLDFKVVAGIERTQADPVQMEGWERFVQLLEVPTDEKSEESKS